jgi:hypothetical protein
VAHRIERLGGYYRPVPSAVVDGMANPAGRHKGEKNMPGKGYRKGPKLFSLARKKALMLGVPQEKGVKLAELISRIQLKEGNLPCFQQRDFCAQMSCCWQASCNAKMMASGEGGQ